MPPVPVAPLSVRSDPIRRSGPAVVPTAPVHLSVRQVTKRFRQTQVLTDLDLEVRRGEIVSLLGPSGCGKTTLLRAIAGLVPVDAGRIVVGGGDITDQPPHLRNVGVVFQSYALFPHLTVRGNIGIGLKAKGWRRADIQIDALVRGLRRQDHGDQQLERLGIFQLGGRLGIGGLEALEYRGDLFSVHDFVEWRAAIQLRAAISSPRR